LPYRVLRLCGGDMGFASATYDFEVFSTAQDRWLEISSVSNFETFQSQRLKLRFKGQDGKTQLAHTLSKFISIASRFSRNFRKLPNRKRY
jgi:seryl-tRNA synthetase